MQKEKILQRSFYNRSTVAVAQELLGKYLIYTTKEGRTVGRIVETEAYLSTDPGSHSFHGMTKRNEQMFGEPGTAYVYFIYGMYYCFNVVTREKGIGEAVLIRALEPVSGIEIMRKRRDREEIESLCSGPAKLVKAMGITPKDNGRSLFTPNFCITKPSSGEKIPVVATPRIGLSEGKEHFYRFYIKDNKFISRK
jgi:DNA-3-methyladenine glycosylase